MSTYETVRAAADKDMLSYEELVSSLSTIQSNGAASAGFSTPAEKRMKRSPQTNKRAAVENEERPESPFWIFLVGLAEALLNVLL